MAWALWQDSEAAPLEVFAASDTGAHQDRGAPQSCDSSDFGVRQLIDHVSQLATPSGFVTAGSGVAPVEAIPGARRFFTPGPTADSVVLRY